MIRITQSGHPVKHPAGNIGKIARRDSSFFAKKSRNVACRRATFPERAHILSENANAKEEKNMKLHETHGDVDDLIFQDSWFASDR
jgi:hypothetical protein